MSGRNIMRYKHYRFVSVYACRVCAAYVAGYATAHQASMKQSGRPNDLRPMLNVHVT